MKWVWRGAGFLLLILLVLGLGEKILRSLPAQPWFPVSWQLRLHERTRRHQVVANDDVGFLLQPHQKQAVRNRDYNYVKETDAYGFPNREPWPQRAEIVVLGDSLVTGEGVGFEAQFTTLIDRQLADQRVVNLGVPGAGPERQYRLYRRFGHALKPRWVVTCWYLASDLDNDAHFHGWVEDSAGMDYNRFRLTYNRRLHPQSRWSPSRLLKRSLLVALGREVTGAWLGESASTRLRRPFPDGTEMLFDQRKLLFVTTPVAAADARIERAFDSLARLRQAAQRQQASVLVVLIPSKEELFGVTSNAPTDNAVARVRQRLQAAHMPVLDLYTVLRQTGMSQPPFFSRDSHLNHLGNRIVAEHFMMWWRDRALRSAGG
ncbi:MAG: SGNH/GDSL hydrolase family protein [Candidatus Tectomicrobia bacterium]|nr:SGNH/GDSL hydrolase family protein [Candidatus Tectomicrobia bacterium]